MLSNKIKSFSAIMFFAVLFSFCVGLFRDYVSPYLLEIGFSESLIAFIFSIGSLAIFVSSPSIGLISDKLGRKKVLISMFTVLATSLVFFLFVLSTGSVLLAVLAGLLQLSSVMGVEIVLLSMLEDAAPKEKRGFWTGLFQSLRGIGSFLGPAAASILVLFLPISELFKLAFIFIFFMIALAIILHEKHFNHKIKKSDFNFIRDLVSFWKNKKLRAVGVLGMAIHVAEKFLLVFLPIFIIKDLELALFWVGVAAALKYVFKLPEFLYGILIDKIGGGKLVIIGAFIKTIGVIAFSLSSSVLSLFLILAFSSIGGGLWNTAAWAYMSEIGEKIHKEGRTVGSFISLTAAASFMSMVITGILIPYLGIRGMFVFTGIIGLLGVSYAFRSIYNNSQNTI